MLVISITVSLLILQLTMKEPILQLRIVELGFSPSLAGLFFTVEVVSFMATSTTLSFIDRRYKNLDFILLMSVVLSIVGFFLMGPQYLLGSSTSVVPICVGMFINGCTAAFAITNGVSAIIEHKKYEYWDNEKEFHNMVSGTYSMFFALGECAGPISGSMLTHYFNGFTSAMTVMGFIFCAFLPAAVYAYGALGKRRRVKLGDYELIDEEN